MMHVYVQILVALYESSEPTFIGNYVQTTPIPLTKLFKQELDTWNSTCQSNLILYI